MPASLVSRFIASGIDLVLGGCAVLIALMLWSRKGITQIATQMHSRFLATGTIPDEILSGIAFATLVGVTLPFLFAIQVARQGATPGKAFMQLTVRSVATGNYPPYTRALGREALRFLSIGPLIVPSQITFLLFGFAAFVIFDMSKSRLSQTWYDRATQLVIVTPSPEKEP
jgi:hypothetical protein